MLSVQQISRNYANYKIRNRIQKFYSYKILKEKALSKLGHKCVVCGELNSDYLELDHINNDGYKDGRPRNSIQYFVKNELDVSKFQLLCANCHLKKTKIYKELKTMETLGIQGFA